MIPVLTVIVLILIASKPPVQKYLTAWLEGQMYLLTESLTAQKGRGAVLIPFAGLLFLILCFAYLEFEDPFYFTQDDNFAQFLPVILHGCRNFAQGVFSTLNPYQLAGSPISDLGIYALTYPVTYFSYFFSTLALSNEYATIEVFVILHLLLGYGACYAMFRAAGLGPWLAVLAALSFILSGYSLIVGRSWYYMAPTVFWFPCLMCLLFVWRQGRPGWRWAVLTGIVIGGFFHAGNVQMWTYGIMFFLIGALLSGVSGAGNREKTLYFLAALFLGLALAMPLLIPNYLATKDISRKAIGSGIPLPDSIWAMLLPYPLSPLDKMKMGKGLIYYAGSFFTAAGFCGAILGIAALICFWRNPDRLKRILAASPWFILAIAAFDFARGPEGFLWPLAAHAPPFNKFACPVKFMPFLNLFLILTGGLTLERFARRHPFRGGTVLFIFFSLLSLLFYQVSLCRVSFFSYGDDPYPKLPASLIRALGLEGESVAHRIYVSAPIRSNAGNYVYSLMHNFPTVYRIPSVLGYEKLVIHPEISEESLLRYGVRYILEDRKFSRNRTPFPPLTKSLLTEKAQTKDVKIFEINDPDPMAFTAGNPGESYPLDWTGRGARVDLSMLSVTRDVVVNMIYRKVMKAYADGKQLPLKADRWKRIRVSCISPVKELEICYEPSFGLGFAAGALVLIPGFCFLAWANVLGRRTAVDPLSHSI